MTQERNIIALYRMFGDRKLSFFVSQRKDGRHAAITLENDRRHEIIFHFEVPIDTVDTFEKAVAYFQPIAAVLEAPASDFNREAA